MFLDTHFLKRFVPASGVFSEATEVMNRVLLGVLPIGDAECVLNSFQNREDIYENPNNLKRLLYLVGT